MPKRPYPTKVKPVPHLCGDLTEAMRIIRRHCPVGHPDRREALERLREVQHGIHQLRFNLSAAHGAPSGSPQEAREASEESGVPYRVCEVEGCSRGLLRGGTTCRQHHPNRCIAINVNSFNGGRRCNNVNSEPGVLCWKHSE